MRISLIAIFAAVLIAACGQSHSDDPAPKHHAQVYTDGSHTYARTYDDSSDTLLWYILILNNSSTNPNQAGNTWQPATGGGPSPTSVSPVDGKSVEFNEKGEPQGEPEPTEAGEEVVNEETTETEAQAETEADTTSEDSSSGSDDSSGGDSSSGDSGGGDSGGGGGE